jgi:hypothetical protein
MMNDRQALSDREKSLAYSIPCVCRGIHTQTPSHSSSSAEVVRSCSDLAKISRLRRITLPLVATVGYRSRLALALRQCCDYCLQPCYEVIRINPCFAKKN